MKNFNFKIHENSYEVNIVSHDSNIIQLDVNGTKYEVTMKKEIKKTKTPTLIRSASKRPAELLKVNSTSKKTKIVSPLPGIIVSLKIKVGDTIKIGDSLLILEAMKMENNITAEKDGIISAIHVTNGQQILQDDLLIELE